MHPMSLSHNSFPDKLVESFPGRLVLTALTVLVSALAIPFLFYTNSLFMPVVLRWTSLAWLGLVSGLAARGLLHHSPALVRLLCAWSILSAGLWFSYKLTYGYVGFPITISPNPVLDWKATLQVLVAGIITWLALFAQAKPRLRVLPVKKPVINQPPDQSKAPVAKKPKTVKLDKPATHSDPISLDLPRPLPWQPRLKNLGESMRMWQRRVSQAAASSRQKAERFWHRSRQGLQLRLKPSNRQISFPTPRLKVRTKSSSPAIVNLVGEEEHRCPYCLEIVDPDDPRGVKICPVCHTYHHADCWAVTGACQVPHHHA